MNTSIASPLERITSFMGAKARALAAVLALSAAAAGCDADRCCEITAPETEDPVAEFTYMAADFTPAGWGQPQQGQMYDFCVRQNVVGPSSVSTVADNVDFCYWEIRVGDVGFQPGLNSAGNGDADVYFASSSNLEITQGPFAGGRLISRIEAQGPNGEKTDFRVGSATHANVYPAMFTNWDSGLGAAVANDEINPGVRLWNGQTVYANDDGTPHRVSLEGAPTKAYKFFSLTDAYVVHSSGGISRDSAVALVGEDVLAARESQFVPREGATNDTIYVAGGRVPQGWGEPRTSRWMMPGEDVSVTHLPGQGWNDDLSVTWQNVRPGGTWAYNNAQIGLPFGVTQWQQAHTSTDASLIGQTMENRFYAANMGAGRVPTLELHKDHTANALESHLAVTMANPNTGLPGKFRNSELVARTSNGQGSFQTGGDVADPTTTRTLPYSPSQATTQTVSTFWELKTDSIISPYSIVSPERFREVAGGGN